MSELIQNSQARQEALKDIVRDLHQGSDIKSARRKFDKLIRNVSPEEIAQMEQALISEGVPVEQVQQLCEVHVQVFKEALKKQKSGKLLPGHPIHTYKEENRAAKQLLKEFKKAANAVARGQDSSRFNSVFSRLREIELHYQRKENQLFPYLETVNFSGPSKVMWGKHDEIRALFKEVQNYYESGDTKSFKKKSTALIHAIKQMVFLEERILFPTALRKLSTQVWAEIRRGEGEIGYAWVRPGNLWDPNVAVAESRDGTKTEQPAPAQAAPRETRQSGTIPLDVGELSAKQINLMLKNLPVDITYVDEQDKVRYYSQGKERIFPRSPGIIGRDVQNCHPPKSVHIVQKILDSFRKREQKSAEFWLELKGRFVHIRYFALYDEADQYLGVIEMSQDVTEIRSLEGQKTLLD